MNNHIEIIEKFFLSNNKILLINQVNENIGEFYVRLLKFFAVDKKIKLVFKENYSAQQISQNLFEDVTIGLFYITQSKKIEEVMLSNEKSIIITDYRNWKKHSSKTFSINGYKFEDDLKYILKNLFKISNSDLFNFCKLSPALAFSEIEKYLINNENYLSDLGIMSDENFLVNIRKDIFNEKKQNMNLQRLFNNIKNEVIYKKFNFLIY